MPFSFTILWNSNLKKVNLGKILNSDCFPLDGCSDSKFGSNYSKICMQPCMTLTQTGKVAKSWKNAWKYDYSETFGISLEG